MRYRRWLVPALAAAVLTAPAPARAQDAAQDSLAELFYTYTNDNVVSEYTDPDYLAASGQTARKTCDGWSGTGRRRIRWWPRCTAARKIP